MADHSEIARGENQSVRGVAVPDEEEVWSMSLSDAHLITGEEQVEKHARAFAQSQFANTAAGEVYGEAEDFERADEQTVPEQKAPGLQTGVFVAALALLLALGYWLLG